MEKVLVLSRNAWINENSTGNTMSNLFDGYDVNCIANIFCRNERPNNAICNKYYKVDDAAVLKSVFDRKPCGGVFDIETGEEVVASNGKTIYDMKKIKSLVLLKWAREIIWSLGKWKNDTLRKFVEDFQPDYIYMHIFDSFYMHKLLYYVAKITNAKIILYTGDDYLTLNQLSLSPFYWINRLILRKYVKKSIQQSFATMCMTQQQIDVYKQIVPKEYVLFNKKLIKCFDEAQKAINTPIRIVYAGNLFPNRWQTLAKLSLALERINGQDEKIVLDIYSGTKLNAKMKKALRHAGTNIMGSVTRAQLKNVYENASVLLHVESYKIKDKLAVMLSLSTKIFDYISYGKCIVGIGPKEVASMQFLKDNNLAILIENKDDIFTVMQDLLKNNSIIDDMQKNVRDYCMAHAIIL